MCGTGGLGVGDGRPAERNHVALTPVHRRRTVGPEPRDGSREEHVTATGTLEERFVALIDDSRRRSGLNPSSHGTQVEYIRLRRAIRGAVAQGKTFAGDQEARAQALKLIPQIESTLTDAALAQRYATERRDVHDALLDLVP